MRIFYLDICKVYHSSFFLLLLKELPLIALHIMWDFFLFIYVYTGNVWDKEMNERNIIIRTEIKKRIEKCIRDIVSRSFLLWKKHKVYALQKFK